ncbi:MAG: GGDEF domain-containing protein [Erythrobacter sp.]|jgi:diguanylate cyclase (GGDEF)-like protein|nr:GGDEF domain-containing protein [Erythrobacter sp.]
MQAIILTFIIPAIALIFCAVFAGLWWQDRARTHIAAYAYCYAALAAGIIINIVIFEHVRPIGIVSYHLLSMSGLIALAWATAHRVGLRAPLKAYTASVFFTAALLWACAEAGEMEALRMAQNVNSSLLMALMAQNLWHAPSRRPADRAVIWVLAAFSIFGFVRPLLSTFSDQVFGPGEQGAATLFAIHVFVLAIFLTLQAIALIATVIVDRTEIERDIAARDPLSGLPMRAMFEREALGLQDVARERGVPISLIIADIDHFKVINDTYGHAAGDKVIAEFGRLIAHEIRPRDLCGRIGGEEFCVVALKCDGENARALANRIGTAVRQMRVVSGQHEIGVTASFGIAQWDLYEPYEAVFKRADAALYRAKRAGRDASVLAIDVRREDDHEAVADASLAQAARSGLQEAEIVPLGNRTAARLG